jgi:hypothetical protein
VAHERPGPVLRDGAFVQRGLAPVEPALQDAERAVGASLRARERPRVVGEADQREAAVGAEDGEQAAGEIVARRQRVLSRQLGRHQVDGRRRLANVRARLIGGLIGHLGEERAGEAGDARSGREVGVARDEAPREDDEQRDRDDEADPVRDEAGRARGSCHARPSSSAIAPAGVARPDDGQPMTPPGVAGRSTRSPGEDG